MKNNGSAMLVVILIVVVLLIGGGVWWYFTQNSQSFSSTGPSQSNQVPIATDTAMQSSTPASVFSLPQLPTEVTIPSIVNIFSYYQVSFGVPWKDAPQVVTSADGAATQLKFAGGQFVTILKASPYTGIASSVTAEAQSKGNLQQIQSLYGQNNLTSDFAWMGLVLSMNPNQQPSSTTGSVVWETLVPIRATILTSMVGVNNLSAIYAFTTPHNGFEVVSQVSEGSDTVSVAYVLIYDANDTPHDLVIGGATQAEVQSIISSIKI